MTKQCIELIHGSMRRATALDNKWGIKEFRDFPGAWATTEMDAVKVRKWLNNLTADGLELLKLGQYDLILEAAE